MLQPLKPISSTASTEATEPTDAVRPIAEQRPGNTLQDRLYRKPEITGGGKMPAEKGNDSSLYQQYSLAKYLPTTPLTPLDPADPGSTFSNFASKFTNYADFWSGLGAFQKQPDTQEFVGDRYGTATIDSSLKPYMERYGLKRGLGFLKDIASADKLQANRQNPFFQPLMLKGMDKYFDTNEVMSLTKVDVDGKRQTFSGRLGGQEIFVNKQEISQLQRLAEENGLGQSGFQELLDRTYQAKVSYAAQSFIPKIQSALDNPESADWNELSSGMAFPTEFGLDSFEGFSEKLTDMLSNPISGLVGGVAGEGAVGLGEKLGLGAKPGGVGAAVEKWLGPVTAIAGMVNAFFEQKKLAKWEGAKFGAIKNGKLATSINDYSGSERNNIEEIAEQLSIDPNDMVKALSAMQQVALYNSGMKLESLGKKYGESAKSDRAIQFSDTGMSLSKTYNPYGGK